MGSNYDDYPHGRELRSFADIKRRERDEKREQPRAEWRELLMEYEQDIIEDADVAVLNASREKLVAAVQAALDAREAATWRASSIIHQNTDGDDCAHCVDKALAAEKRTTGRKSGN